MASRSGEIWNSFERVIDLCEEEKADLLLICGDLFHRQPLVRELKEVNAMFSKLSKTEVVMIVGNHDYLKSDSYYRTFEWAEHVHVLLDRVIDCVEFPKLHTAVYGHSYHSKEIREKTYAEAVAPRRQPHEILMLHGGDEKHVPLKKEELERLGYEYVALGHIHKPQMLVKDRIAYAGALEPIDKNDIGPHGCIVGEITKAGCQTEFVPISIREYKHLVIEVTKETSGHQVKNLVKHTIEENGRQNIYKVQLTGFRDPDILFDFTGFDVYGNIVELTDRTKPAYDFEKLKKQNKNNILGCLIEEWGNREKDSVEYLALCEGVQALMETRRA